jgi:uncharacterized protein
MWDKPSINRLPGERLHLRHGPIAIQLKVWAAPDVVRQANRLVMRHFPKILPELGDELEALKSHQTKPARFDGRVAQSMAAAALPFAQSYVTPFLAMTGAVSDEVIRLIEAAGSVERVYVNNAGNLALRIGPGQSLTFGPRADCPVENYPAINQPVTLSHDMGIGGIATSGAGCPGLSLGVADSVTVFAETGARAGVAAAIIGNSANVESKAITRKPASKIDPESAFGDAPVTTKVDRLTSAEIETALTAGARQAEACLANDQIKGAILILQGEVKVVGPIGHGVGAKR